MAAKWQGMVTAPIPGATADEAWSLLSDFCSLHRWVPGAVHTCYRLEGADGKPGCVRYCAGPVNKSGSGAGVGWAKERLAAFDAAGRTYSYEVIESNKGIGRYAAAMKVVPCGRGCVLEWSFEADPVKGWTEEAFRAYLGSLAEAVGKNVGEAVGNIGKQ